MFVCGCGSLAERSGSTGAGLFQPQPDRSDVRALPQDYGAGQLGVERRVASDCRGDVADTGRANRARPPGRRKPAADLRRFLVQQIERHIERQLMTPPVLEAE